MKKMHKLIALALSCTMGLTLLTGCGKKEGKPSSQSSNPGSSSVAEETFTPEKTISLVCVSSAGGGSDINCRAVIDTFGKIGVDANFIVDYKNDGGGAVGWQYTAKADDEYTVMCYGFGDTINMVKNTDFRMKDYRGVAVVSAEQLALLSTPDCKYADFKEAVEAAKNGTVVTIAGAGGVDLIIYNKLLEVTGLTEAQMTYVQHNSTGEAVVTMLGNHSDFVICKPSSSISYVESGELVPYVAFQQERFAAPLDTAPTISELGFEHIEAPMWRGFVVSANMPEAAYQYYCDIFQKLVDSPEWTADYVDKYAASPLFMIGDEANDYLVKAEAEFEASL